MYSPSKYLILSVIFNSKALECTMCNGSDQKLKIILKIDQKVDFEVRVWCIGSNQI